MPSVLLTGKEWGGRTILSRLKFVFLNVVPASDFLVPWKGSNKVKETKSIVDMYALVDQRGVNGECYRSFNE